MDTAPYETICTLGIVMWTMIICISCDENVRPFSKAPCTWTSRLYEETSTSAFGGLVMSQVFGMRRRFHNSHPLWQQTTNWQRDSQLRNSIGPIASEQAKRPAYHIFFFLGFSCNGPFWRTFFCPSILYSPATLTGN
jgi:hypothetical protein